MCVHADGRVHEGVCACVGRTEIEVGCLSCSLSTIHLTFFKLCFFCVHTCVCMGTCTWQPDVEVR